MSGYLEGQDDSRAAVSLRITNITHQEGLPCMKAEAMKLYCITAGSSLGLKIPSRQPRESVSSLTPFSSIFNLDGEGSGASCPFQYSQTWEVSLLPGGNGYTTVAEYHSH